MTRILTRFVALLLLVALPLAWAGEAVIWDSSQFGKLLPSLGIKLNDNKQVRSLTVDPTAGAGIVAPVGSIGLRDNAGTGEGWFKTAAGNTAWSNFLTGSSGWAITGNSGLTAGPNFLGTNDAVDLVFKTNATEVFRFTAAGTYDTTLGFGYVNSSAAGILASTAGTANQIAGIDNAGIAVEFKTVQGTVNRLTVTQGVGTITANVDTTQFPSSTGGDTNKALIATGANAAGWSLIADANVAAAGAANIARTKLASGTANHVIINDGAGVLSSEAQLATSRGGTNHGDYTAGSVIFAGAGGTSLTENNAQFFWDNATARLFMGANTSIAGSNAGVQYSDATTANRGQIKLHSYFNGASIAGVSTLTSRSGTVGINNAVVAGQDYSKWTAQAGATTVGSAPISGAWAFKANTVNALTVTTDFHLQLTNLAGTLADRLYLSSEGLLQLPGYTTGIAHFDASGNITSSAVSLTADVSGILPVANGGTNLSAVGTANQLFGTNAAANAFEHKAVTATAAGVLVAPGDIKSQTSLTIEDPGAGTNTISFVSPTTPTTHNVFPPPTVCASGQVWSDNGAGVMSCTTISAAPTIFGTRAAGRSVVAGTGITSGASHMSTTAQDQLIFVTGSGGVDITASPQIQAHTVIGATMRICGTDNTNWVLLQNGTGLALNGPAELGKDDCINFMWAGFDGTTSDYVETSRNF